ncbi:MAG: SDR family NAD(P)-dependent oxidoreductase [Spirochaetaceae bacterium]|nr:MAG: SDR family NAD(P)-dependent oxidoreductase [Spirochaetaceae bacterium]
MSRCDTISARQQVAALLRGFTFDGQKGLLVRTCASSATQPAAATIAREQCMAIECPGATAEQPLEPSAIEQLARALSTRLRTSVPILIDVEGVGRYLLGRSLDELDQTEAGGRRSRELPPPVSAAAADAVADRQAAVRGKVVVVTGGAQGFGAEIARMLCAAGATLVIADLNAKGAADFAAELNAGAGRRAALSLPVDVADEESVAAMVAAVSSAVGGIDLFISNAGVLKAGSVTTLTLSDFDFVTRVNYTGFFLCTKHAAPLMALQWRAARTFARHSGGDVQDAAAVESGYFSDIIQINSKSGLEGSNRNGAYAGAKFGGIGLVQSFAKELVSDGIKVNAICPGNFFEGPLWSDPDRGLFVQYLNTGKVPGAATIADVKRYYEQQVPMGRGCRGADVVRAILYAVEQKYETGQAIPVTGGQVMLS